MPKILIAEDDQFLANICRLEFERQGFEVALAADGAAAVEHLIHDLPDVVLLDLMLPEIDGVSLLRLIRSQEALCELPVIVMSNSDYFSGLAQSAWRAGATNFLNKGMYGPAQLVEEVRKLYANAAPEPQPTEHGVDQPPPVPARAHFKRATGEIRVIIADDDKVVHSVLKIFMEQANFVVHSAFDGQQAMEMAEAEPPDIIVLDGMMPKLNGFELLKLWQRHPTLAKIPVIMLTAKPEEYANEDAIGNGAVEFLTKPFNPNAVVNLIREYVGPRG